MMAGGEDTEIIYSAAGGRRRMPVRSHRSFCRLGVMSCTTPILLIWEVLLHPPDQGRWSVDVFGVVSGLARLKVSR